MVNSWGIGSQLGQHLRRVLAQPWQPTTRTGGAINLHGYARNAHRIAADGGDFDEQVG